MFRFAQHDNRTLNNVASEALGVGR